MIRIPLPWLAIIVGALIFFSLWEKSPSDLIGPPATPVSDFPHAYMIDIETQEYDTDGKLVYTMSTPAAQYFQISADEAGPNDYTLIYQPKLYFYSEREALPWRLSASEGRANASGTEVRLTNDVRAEQQSAKQGLVQVTTSELFINTLEQFAETDKAVKMRSRQGQLETVGMRAHLDEDRIELLSQVRGTYAP